MSITLTFTDESPQIENIVVLEVSVENSGNVVGQRVFVEAMNGAKKISKQPPAPLTSALEEALSFCEMRGAKALVVVDPSGKFDMRLLTHVYQM